jgi:hypothetical protein
VRGTPSENFLAPPVGPAPVSNLCTGPEHRRTAPPPTILSTVPHTSTPITNQTSRSVLATTASTLPSGQSTRREQEQYPSQAIFIAPGRQAPRGMSTGDCDAEQHRRRGRADACSGSSAATCRPAVRGACVGMPCRPCSRVPVFRDRRIADALLPPRHALPWIAMDVCSHIYRLLIFQMTCRLLSMLIAASSRSLMRGFQRKACRDVCNCYRIATDHVMWQHFSISCRTLHGPYSRGKFVHRHALMETHVFL